MVWDAWGVSSPVALRDARWGVSTVHCATASRFRCFSALQRGPHAIQRDIMPRTRSRSRIACPWSAGSCPCLPASGRGPGGDERGGGASVKTSSNPQTYSNHHITRGQCKHQNYRMTRETSTLYCARAGHSDKGQESQDVHHRQRPHLEFVCAAISLSRGLR